MPETLIAIVALLGAKEGAEDVAIGAIVGAPFLLATLAMGLVGLFAYLYRDKREQGLRAATSTGRPWSATCSSSSPSSPLALAARLGAAGARCGSRSGSLFLARLRRSTSAAPCAAAARCRSEETLDPLIFERRAERREDPALALCVIQLLVGLGAMVGGAHLFVEELLAHRREHRRRGRWSWR